MNRSQLFRISVLTFGFAILSVAISARADEPDKPRGQQPILRFSAEEGEGQEGIVVQIGEPSEYWLGVAVAPLNEKERAKTKLPEGQGLEIEQVMPNSPAAKAGLRAEDIVRRVDGKDVGNLADLQKIVQESAGKPLSFDLLRNGKETTIAATPIKRAEAQRIVIAEEKEGEEGKQGEPRPMVIELQKLMERAQAEAQKQAAGQPRVQWQVAPGPAWTFQAAPFPEDLSVTIKKKGNKPARIKVSRGIQSWTVNENEIGLLPPEIRGYVQRVMSGHGAPQGTSGMPGQPGMTMGMPRPGIGMMPGQSLGPRGGQPGAANPTVARAPNTAEQAQRMTEELDRRIHELQEQKRALGKRIEELRSKK